MANAKKAEGEHAVRRPRDAGTAAPASRAVAVPHAWLIALTVLLVLPWLVVAVLYLRSAEEPASPVASTVTASAEARATGPWGHLTATPIVVSPPLEYVAADWSRTDAPDTWYFPSTSADELEEFFVFVGLSREQARGLRSNARPDPRSRGLVVTPDDGLVRTMAPEVRARLYLQLAKSTLNFDQVNSFRFLGSSSEAWLGGSLISRETRQLVEPLIYSDGQFLHFADTELVRSQIADRAELQRLAKALLRQATVLVRLSVRDASEVEGLADYWGRGGRRLDLRPLLESVVGLDRSIDIVHLLPTFARENMYRYPRISTADLIEPQLANCLWTSLNFFRQEPDDRFRDINVALAVLRRDYYVVEHGFQLGDIVAFLDEEGDLYHVAVYLADGLVFTKNGMSPMAPWSIMTIDQVKGYYKARTEDPRLIYHRRNDF
ncbi:MAG TPA: hypothetical protein VLD67_02105 [Vicinamibacterales bacterium]|nr:hypothetical protein [Vicinamibacterales bacterium]